MCYLSKASLMQMPVQIVLLMPLSYWDAWMMNLLLIPLIFALGALMASQPPVTSFCFLSASAAESQAVHGPQRAPKQEQRDRGNHCTTTALSPSLTAVRGAAAPGEEPGTFCPTALPSRLVRKRRGWEERKEGEPEAAEASNSGQRPTCRYLVHTADTDGSRPLLTRKIEGRKSCDSLVLVMM